MMRTRMAFPLMGAPSLGAFLRKTIRPGARPRKRRVRPGREQELAMPARQDPGGGEEAHQGPADLSSVGVDRLGELPLVGARRGGEHLEEREVDAAYSEVGIGVRQGPRGD